MEKLGQFFKSWAFSALGFFVSLAAIWFAWDANDMARQQINISMKQNEKTTDPYVIVEIETIPSMSPQEHKFALYAKNVGLGPAFILGFEVYKNGKRIIPIFPENRLDLAASFGLKNNATSRDEIRQGQVIPVGGRIAIFEVTKWNELLAPQDFSSLVEKGLREHSLAICYASVYPERRFALFGRGLNEDNVACTKVTAVDPAYANRVQLSSTE